ncbi:M48 family metallopeptidase [Pseudobacteriovorax antillogorgiicola]|uniref:Peptidase family M48 n=1 Tax=Pseudobacteriovorax antillogorgiicola TaxID=1513793 RepID=A0A1Y6C9B4_9BACT|nr:M48 family metallopeptidase [Pseudobacteriovorax antillogorgiicola]TCS50742.1 peptidase M48-like protein [Pseudobacteriovorax antillogorgiicola]SMF41026.1 Peptidase family M48 [Pseudobacteriovorax antillogorgiicola]
MLKAHGFFKDKTKSPCEFNIQQDGIKVRSTEKSIQEHWPWSQTSIKIGGAADKLLFFTPKNIKEIESIYTERNRLIVQQLKTIPAVEVQSFLKDLKMHRVSSLSILVTAMAVLLALVAFVWIGRDPIIDAVVDRVPYEWEQELGSRLVGITIPAQNLISSGPAIETLKPYIKRLQDVLPQPMNDVKIYIAKSSDINAFALPGGHVVFNEGLLRAASNIEEILGVAGHELAHVEKRHVLRGIVQAIGLYLVVDLIMGDMTGILAVISENSQLLLQSGFSREQESQADEVGFNLLVAANINPQGLVSFFQIIEETQKKQNEMLGDLAKPLSFLSTHPATDERINAIKDRIREEKLDIPAIDFDYESFKAKIISN